MAISSIHISNNNLRHGPILN
jgi:hypothetical protein